MGKYAEYAEGTTFFSRWDEDAGDGLDWWGGNGGYAFFVSGDGGFSRFFT